MKKILLILFVFDALAKTAASQNIKGKVVDATSRQPLENVSIINADQPGNGTLTDQHGSFMLKSQDKNTKLIISFVGYKAASVLANQGDEIKIELLPDAINLKDVVVLTSGHLSKFSTLSKIDLDLKPVRNTQELLRLVPGLFIAQHAGGGKAEQIFLRGFDCDHGTDVQVSVDGMPVNMVSHAHGQGYADSHFIIPETVNNIDFGAGPYYTQHGNLNTAGYVAFSTYNAIPVSRIQIEAGLFNTFRTLAMIDLLKKNKDKQSAYVAGDFYYTDGATDHPQNFNRFNLFGKYNLAVSRHTQLTASVSAFKSKWDASGQVPARAVEGGMISRFGSIDPSEGGNTERYNTNLIITHHFAGGSNWENQFFYSRYIFNLYSDFTFFLNDPVNGDEINQAEKRNVFGYSSKLDHHYYFGNLGLQSTYGAGLRYDVTNDSKLAHVVKRQFLNYIQLGDIREANAFAYVQQQLTAGRWLIDAGTRLDYLHFAYFDKLTASQLPAQGKTVISPKLNIQYTVNPRVQFFIKSGKGFHSNDTRVVVANEGHDILPAAYGSDIGFIVKPSKQLLLTVTAWYLYLDQEFVYMGDDGNIAPSGKTKRKGIDIIGRYQFNKTLFANVNLNFTRPRAIGELKGQDYIPLAPTATSTGGIFYKKTEGFNGGISYRYIKSRPANQDGSIIAKGYFIIDGSINYTKKRYEIGLAIENMLNAKWNEAQFATESQLQGESSPVTELNFTPGAPFFARMKFALFF
jgi:hypothetical protein